MKGFLLILFSLPLILNAQERYHIVGNINQLKQYDYVYLEYGLIGEEKLDSARIQNGRFEFKGEVEDPTYARLTIKKKNKLLDSLPGYMELYLSEGKIYIEGEKLDSKLLRGNEINETFARYKEGIEPLRKWRRQKNLFDEGVSNQIIAGLNKEQDFDYQFLQNNPLNYFSFTLMQSLLSEKTVFEFEKKYEVLKPLIKRERTKEIFENRISRLKNVGIGVIPQDFSFETAEGEQLKLSNLSGKYVLLSFWDASTQIRSNGQFDTLLHALNEKNNSDFIILRVSLHSLSFHDKWREQVKLENSPFLLNAYVNDENRKLIFDKYARKQSGYEINELFGTYLLDKNGRITDVGVENETLKSYLSK